MTPSSSPALVLTATSIDEAFVFDNPSTFAARYDASADYFTVREEIEADDVTFRAMRGNGHRADLPAQQASYVHLAIRPAHSILGKWSWRHGPPARLRARRDGERGYRKWQLVPPALLASGRTTAAS